MRAGPVLTTLLASLLATQLQAAPIQLPNGQTLPQVDFERHVQAVLDRQGCNAGACHGSLRRQNGFTLSLFAESPERDYHALLRTSRGRLLHFGAPADSLLLRRAQGQGGHPGGQRLRAGTWEYEVIQQWIAAGAPWQKDSGKIIRIEVQPRELRFTEPGQSRQLQVFVHFADGTRADLTPFSDFRLPEKELLAVSSDGAVTGLQRGSGSVLVYYRGRVAAIPVWIGNPPQPNYPVVPEVNYIDREIFGQLRELNLIPSDLCSDNDFLRRVMIDTVGTLPTPEEIRAFLASKDPNKRRSKIEELLAHPRHAAVWAQHFWNWTALRADGEPVLDSQVSGWNQLWFEWLRRRLVTNESLASLVEGMLLATSREGRPVEDWLKELEMLAREARAGFNTSYPQRTTLDLFWRGGTTAEVGERIAAAFLGIRLDCARCHQHPVAPLTPEDQRAFIELFRQVRQEPGPEVRDLARCNQRHRDLLSVRPPERASRALWTQIWREVHVTDNSPLSKSQKPRFLLGPELKLSGDLRQGFTRWLLARDNPYFARNLVNRVWAHYFGRGLVTPFDSFSDANPPTHPRLLELLAQDFAAHNFNLQHLERTILLSRTYQLSSKPNATNEHDRQLYSRFVPHRLQGRLLLDLLCDATDAPRPLGADVPPGVRALAMTREHSLISYTRRANDWKDREDQLIRLFGRQELQERCSGPDLTSSLHLYGSSEIQQLLERGQRVRALVATGRADEVIMEELFLATLTRFPSAQERSLALDYLQKHKAPGRPLERWDNIVWALINMRDFTMQR